MDTPKKLIKSKRVELVTPLHVPDSPLLERLGFGTGVSVLRYVRHANETCSPWALKRIRQLKAGDKELCMRLKYEADILRKLKHKNVIGYRAMKETQTGCNILALEFGGVAFGQLIEDRYENKSGPFPTEKILKLISDVAEGLDYLHEEVRILHGDMKSFNILVKNDFEIIKICDFGVSLPLDEEGKFYSKKYKNLKYIGTNLWSAPEVINGADCIDTKADIFSFGLVIYESIALLPPHMLGYALTESEDDTNSTLEDLGIKQQRLIKSTHENISVLNECELSFEADDDVDDYDDDDDDDDTDNIEYLYGTRPPLPSDFILTPEFEPIVHLFYLCTNEKSEDRPTAKIIFKLVNEISTNTAIKDIADIAKA